MTQTNWLFAELAVGDAAVITRVVTPEDMYVFARVSGNLNPENLPATAGDDATTPAAPAMWLGSLFSAVLGNLLPGPGMLYKARSLRFHTRARIGDTLTIKVQVRELRAPATVMLETRVERESELIAGGLAEVLAPATRHVIDADSLPELTVQRHRHVARLLAACAALPPMPTAVVAPEEESALLGALAGGHVKLIVPILLGNAAKIRAIAECHGVDLDGITSEVCRTTMPPRRGLSNWCTRVSPLQ